jgi:hypothetical protein
VNDYSITPTLHHSSASRCGINIVRHLQAPPALMNSGHWQRVAAIAALLQFVTSWGAPSGKTMSRSITTALHEKCMLLPDDIDQITHVLADCALPVLIETHLETKTAAIRNGQKQVSRW